MIKPEAYFTKFNNDSNWISGEVGRFKFDAKLYNTPSRLGIDGGRVSVLAIFDGDKFYHNNCVVCYDREWDIEPSEDIMDYFNAVMELLENSEERDLD